MKIKLECSICNGKGYAGEWIEDKKGISYKISDCEACSNGTGKVAVEIIDNRHKSKRKKLLYPDRY